jgi:predicted nucleotidyltransferase
MDVLNKNKNELNSFCKANKIKRLSLFGSYLKNTASKDSDIDLLVEFEADTEYGLVDVARIERELTGILGKKVDLRTQEELSRYFRDTVVREAQVKYEG